MENEIAKSIYLFLLSRVWYLLWKLLCNLFRNISNSAFSYLLVKKTNSASIKSTQYFADLDSINIDSVWENSKPQIIWLIKENVEYHPNMNRDLRAFVTIKKLPDDSQLEAILPIVLEHIVGAVHPIFEAGISTPPVVKLLIPPIIGDLDFGIPKPWFKSVCKHVMRQYISGEFEVTLEYHETFLRRKELQERESLPPEPNKTETD